MLSPAASVSVLTALCCVNNTSGVESSLMASRMATTAETINNKLHITIKSKYRNGIKEFSYYE